MEILIKKLNPNAVIPTYAHKDDAAMDVTAVSINVTDDYIEYDTGLAFEIPEDYCMLIFPRSSNSKQDLLLANSVGVLDSGYRDSLKLRFKRNYRIQHIGNGKTLEKSTFTHHDIYPSHLLVADKLYKVGDRVGQIIIIPRPKITFKEVRNLSESERGTNGFGSTGK